MFSRSIAIVGALLLAGLVTAGARTSNHVVYVDAPVADVWAAFTTKEGVESWMVPKAEVNLAVGGWLKSTYDPSAEIGGPATITNTILAYEPERMLALKNTGAPEGFEHAAALKNTWSVFRFEPVSATRTRVELTGLGWGDDPASDAAYDFFLQGNEWTMQRLAQRFGGEGAAERNDRAMALARRLIGGEWIHDGTSPDGSPFLVRNVLADGPDGVSVVGTGWLGNASGMTPHGATQVWREPVTGAVRFQNINERGAVAAGDIVLEDDDSIVWEWGATAQDGQAAQYHALMRFTGPDSYDFTLSLIGDGGALTRVVHVGFRRVDEAPQKFRRLASHGG